MTKPLAERFFDADMEASALRDDVEDALMRIVEVQEDEKGFLPESLSFKDITFDSYDYSFEFKKTRNGWVPTSEMLAAFWELGFVRCWICYEDGTEKYYGIR